MRAFLICAVLSISAVTLGAQSDDEYERATLAGLPGVGVVVEDLNPDIRGLGLEKADIQTDVELKLREAGIRVLSFQERMSTPGYPYLYVVVGIYKRRDDLCVYNINVAVEQMVKLDRNPSVVVTAMTWGTPGVYGTVGVNNLRTLRESIGDLVNQFVNAYLAANPKR